MNAQALAALQAELYDLVVADLEKAIIHLRSSVPIGSKVFREVIQLQGRHNALEKDQRKGTVSYDDYQLAGNRLRNDLLELIENLTPADFERQPADAVLDRGRTGALLYQIPEQMQLQQTVNCRVRLAYSEAIARLNLPEGPVPEVRSLVVTEVMQVRLIDANALPSFAIKTFSREEQTLAEGVFAEWIFQITPLRAGQCSLLLQVAVVEIVMGKERVREIVFEEQIDVSAETVSPAEPAVRRLELHAVEEGSGQQVEDGAGEQSPFDFDPGDIKYSKRAVGERNIDDWLPGNLETTGAEPPTTGAEAPPPADDRILSPPQSPPPPMPSPPMPAPAPQRTPPAAAPPPPAKRRRLGPLIIGLASVLLLLLIALPVIFAPGTSAPTDDGDEVTDTEYTGSPNKSQPDPNLDPAAPGTSLLGSWTLEAITVNGEPALDLARPVTYSFGQDGMLLVSSGSGQTFTYQYALADERLSLYSLDDGSTALGDIRALTEERLSLRLNYTDPTGSHLMDIELKRASE